MMTNPFDKFAATPKPASEKPPEDAFQRFQKAKAGATPSETAVPAFEKFRVQKPSRVASAAATPRSTLTTPDGPPATPQSMESLLSFDDLSDSGVAPTPGPVYFDVAESLLSDFPRMKSNEKRTFLPGTPKVVALSPLQSGAGLLEVKLEGGLGLSLGGIIETANGVEHLVNSQSPVEDLPLVHGASGVLSLALRRVKEVRRAAFFVTAQSPETLWQGAVTVGFRDAILTFPVGREGSCENLLAVSLFNVAGELVVRYENDFQDAPLKSLLVDFGYNGVVWKNDRLPLFV